MPESKKDLWPMAVMTLVRISPPVQYRRIPNELLWMFSGELFSLPHATSAINVKHE
jgi:hypothetical protein